MVRMTRSIRLSQTRVLPIRTILGNVMYPPLGNLIGNVANGVDGACAPHSPAFRSNTSSASWPLRFPVRANSFPYFPTRSGSPRELTDASTLATEWIRSHKERANGIDKSLESLRETGPCQRFAGSTSSGLNRQTGLLRATLPARLSAFLCLWGKSRSLPSYWHRGHPKNGIKTVRFPCAQNKDSVEKFSAVSFLVF